MILLGIRDYQDLLSVQESLESQECQEYPSLLCSHHFLEAHGHPLGQVHLYTQRANFKDKVTVFFLLQYIPHRIGIGLVSIYDIIRILLKSFVMYRISDRIMETELNPGLFWYNAAHNRQLMK